MTVARGSMGCFVPMTALGPDRRSVAWMVFLAQSIADFLRIEALVRVPPPNFRCHCLYVLSFAKEIRPPLSMLRIVRLSVKIWD